MNHRRSNLFFATSLIVAVSFGCISTSPSLEYSTLQSDRSAICTQKRRDFLVVSSTRIPKGMNVDKVGPYQDKLSANIEHINKDFLSTIGSAYFEMAKDGNVYPRVLASSSYSIDPIHSGQSSHGLPDMRLDWVGGNTFLYWDKKTSSSYDNSNAVVHMRTTYVDFKTPSGSLKVPLRKCDGFYDASFDPLNNALKEPSCAYLIGETHYKPEYRLDNLGLPDTGVFSFISATRFNIGSLFQTNYFAMSDDDRRNRGIASAKSNDRPSVRNSINDSYALLNELLAKADTVSKKVDGEWIIAHHTVDLTDVCKYAKPISDFTAD
jgi:hypothetical protein